MNNCTFSGQLFINEKVVITCIGVGMSITGPMMGVINPVFISLNRPPKIKK